MERKNYNFLTVIAAFGLTLLLFSQCSHGDGRGYLPGSTGKTNEIILVIDDNISSSAIADTVKAFFTQNDLSLPQPEALYDVYAVTQQMLNNQVTLKKHHNILMVNINDTIQENVTVSKDLWATPQLVVNFNANSETAFYSLFRKYRRTILDKLDRNEILRARSLTDFGKNIGQANDILTQFNINMVIPAGFQVAKKDDNFLWLKQQSNRKEEDMTASIMIWQIPYRAELQFSTDSLIRERNRVGQRYIAGPTAGSYMKIATTYIYPQTEIIGDYATPFAVEMRGLWELEGDFMGGPFISYTFAHPTTHQLITIDAFLYHPNPDKRPFLRQLQSIITNVSIDN
jgi:hypothetical protein